MLKTTLRVNGIAETLRALDTELGDNGKLYRRTVKDIKAAGNQAAVRARGYLPAEEDLPSGFTHKNKTKFPESRVPGRARAFPRYDRRAAESSLRVVSARERSVRTDYGWRAGRMFGISLEMKDPAGSVYDVAGNGKSRRQRFKRSNDPRSMAFIGLLKQTWIGDPKWKFRVVLPAVVDTRPEIIAGIHQSLDRARIALGAKRDGSVIR